MAKVIITCAVTGGAHTPSMSDALPVTPQEIADQSIAAAEAGAGEAGATRNPRGTCFGTICRPIAR